MVHRICKTNKIKLLIGEAKNLEKSSELNAEENVSVCLTCACEAHNEHDPSRGAFP